MAAGTLPLVIDVFGMPDFKARGTRDGATTSSSQRPLWPWFGTSTREGVPQHR